MSTIVSFDEHEWPVTVSLDPDKPRIVVSSTAGMRAEHVAMSCINDGRVRMPEGSQLEHALHVSGYAVVSATALAKWGT